MEPHMKRIPTIALLAAGACARHGAGDGARSGEGALLYGRPNVDVARDLDHEGVRTFAEGRYSDALAYFRAARGMGGPASELWNVARCLERLDDPEGAERTLDEYLAQRDVPAADRAEAQREAQAVRSRSSVLTVATVPTGAAATVDGQPAPGPTPVSIEVRPGSHSLVVRRAGYADKAVPFEARFGRAVIVTLDLEALRK
jgi:hypothetical protein